MTKKSLEKKAISIKGKDYILVKDRIIYFNENYANGMIVTELLSEPNDKRVVFEAVVYPDTKNKDRYFNGYSQATWGDGMVNTSAAMENAETSAVGRALAMMGIGVIDSVASVDEMQKAKAVQPQFETGGGRVVEAIEKAAAKGVKTKAKKTDVKCELCGAENLPENVVSYSTNMLGQALCFPCQQTVKKNKEAEQEPGFEGWDKQNE